MSAAPQTNRKRAGLRLLFFVTANCLGLNLAVSLATRWITHRAWHGIFFLDSTFHQFARFLRGKQVNDSWDPMLAALHSWQAHPGGSIYQPIFFIAHIKFQYPLPSLLPYALLSRMGMNDSQIIGLSGIICWIAVGIVALLAVVIAGRSLPSQHPSAATAGEKLSLPEIVAIVLGTLFFFPLLKGCVLGQVQTLLTLGFTAAFYCWMRGREKLAGAIIGVMAMVKPQFALLLLWAALRKRWGALAAGLICAAALGLPAIAIFGWHNNLEYLDVLSSLSRHGESFVANQSMNGLLHRLLFNGTNLTWQKDELPPFRWPIYLGTLLSTVVLLGLAFFYPRERALRGGIADFACIALAATAASPVAWEHHYGILLPIFVWLWFGEYRAGNILRSPFPLAVAYILVSDCLSPINVLANVPVLNILQSYTYIGAFIVFVLLLRSTSAPRLQTNDALPRIPAKLHPLGGR